MDVDSIEPGVDFAVAIDTAVADCVVLLALIGPRWLPRVDRSGLRRLDDADDVVCLELDAALPRGIRVIRVLINGTAMPSRTETPASIGRLAGINAADLRHGSFWTDVERLALLLDRLLTATSGRERAGRRDGNGLKGLNVINAPVSTPGVTPT